LLLVRGATAHVGPRSAALIAAPVWAISVILGISWVGINADSDMAATRYERILEYEKAHASYAYEILATHYQDQQRLPQAIAAMEKAVTFSASPRMYVYLSNLYKAVGRTDDALRVLRKTVRQYPRHDGARNNLVLLLANTSYYDELLAVARDGTIYNPERPIYHYYYGAMLIREGRTQEGIQELVQCKRLGPGPEVMAEIDRVLGGLGPKDGK
ncbi:MAG TPA: tetratricopeptide repeat protein, partial [bacterium]|nr:tetratricopeptide repeat protein [bacterium]